MASRFCFCGARGILEQLAQQELLEKPFLTLEEERPTDPETEKHRIIAVILNDNNRWKDMQDLIDWTFNNYEWK